MLRSAGRQVTALQCHSCVVLRLILAQSGFCAPESVCTLWEVTVKRLQPASGTGQSPIGAALLIL